MTDKGSEIAASIQTHGFFSSFFFVLDRDFWRTYSEQQQQQQQQASNRSNPFRDGAIFACATKRATKPAIFLFSTNLYTSSCDTRSEEGFASVFFGCCCHAALKNGFHTHTTQGKVHPTRHPHRLADTAEWHILFFRKTPAHSHPTVDASQPASQPAPSCGTR